MQVYSVKNMLENFNKILHISTKFDKLQACATLVDRLFLIHINIKDLSKARYNARIDHNLDN